VRITSKATQKVRQEGKEGKNGRSLGKMAVECVVLKSFPANLCPAWHSLIAPAAVPAKVVALVVSKHLEMLPPACVTNLLYR
jgi:hypothetical protein